MVVKTFILKAKARWAKVLGAPPPGYDNGPAEWSVEAVLDEAAEKAFLASGADKFYVKTDKTGEKFVRFVRRATRQDGTEANPISIIDAHGNPWDQKVLIGNGSVLNFKFSLNEVKSQGTKRLKPSVIALQVWDYVKYIPKSSFPTKESSNITEKESWTDEAQAS